MYRSCSNLSICFRNWILISLIELLKRYPSGLTRPVILNELQLGVRVSKCFTYKLIETILTFMIHSGMLVMVQHGVKVKQQEMRFTFEESLIPLRFVAWIS